MAVLSVIQSHCMLHQLSVPQSIIGNADSTVIQLLEVLRTVIGELIQESKFQVSTQEATLTLAPNVYDQGPMTTICPSGYMFPIFETFFDRTLKRPLVGPVSESEWQNLMALPTAGTWYRFRIKDDHLWVYPQPTIAPYSLIAFEYISSWWAIDVDGAAKADITADTDTFVFPDRIIKAGLRYFWKQIKGLPYQADETAYWNLVNNYIARDKVKRRIKLDEPQPTDFKPGIMVPSNTWPVS